jgi:uncharacterized membrane protein YphA (DoxX/SURF4 family)
MRLVAGIALIAHGVGDLRTVPSFEATAFDLFAIGDGALLVAGLWTPLAGSLVLIFALWSTLAQHGNLCPCIFLATIGAALALLGPGGWSMDAWLFGWKRIDTQG